MSKWAYLRGDILTIVLGNFEIMTQEHDNLSICVVRCAIWYHLHNLKNVKNIHGQVLILVELQA